MKKVLVNTILVLIIVALLGVSGFCVFNATKANSEEVKNPVLSLEIKDYGKVKIEMYPEYAPNTVKNITKLANNGYYNGKIFYGMDEVATYVGRGADGNSVNPKLSDIDTSVSKTLEVENTDSNDDMVNVNTDSTSGVLNPDDYVYEIDGEFVANGFTKNSLRHEKGVVSLVRSDYSKQISSLTKESYNSGSSQFTILMKDNNDLNGMYAAFGKVIEGMDIVEKIYGLETKKVEEESTDGSSQVSSEDSIKAFATAPVIEKATVETYGEDYGLPKVHEAFDYSAYLQELMTKYYTSQQ